MATNTRVTVKSPERADFRFALKLFLKKTSPIVQEATRRQHFESPREEAKRKARAVQEGLKNYKEALG